MPITIFRHHPPPHNSTMQVSAFMRPSSSTPFTRESPGKLWGRCVPFRELPVKLWGRSVPFRESPGKLWGRCVPFRESPGKLWGRCVPFRESPGKLWGRCVPFRESPATAACAAFAHRFIQGDWLSLFNEAVAAAIPASRPHSVSSARSIATFARLNRAKRFAHCGDWSRSLAALEAGELAPPTPETVTALKAKHPPATEELPDWLSDFLPLEVPQLTIPFLHQALRSAPRGTATGPSGWLIEHLRDTFLSYQTHLPHLLRLFQNWLQGDLPQTVRPYFTTSNLVALQKPQGGVRPIAIGEILPRLLSRCVTLHFKQQIRDFFLPSLQFGYAVSAGIEVMAHAVQPALSLYPEWVVLELDVANAFNSFSRSAMFNALRDSLFSSLILFFRLFYAFPSSLHYRSGPLIETLQSSSGVRQGDPCGPFLFALTQHLAIRPIQRQSPDLFITSYADDTYMVGPAHDVFLAYTALTARLNDLCLRVHDVIKHEVYRITSELGYVVQLEDSHLLSGRRPDISCRDISSGTTWALDVSVADPQHGPPNSKIASVIGSATSARETEKRTLYASSLQNRPDVKLLPLVLETFGCFSTAFLNFIKDCSRRGATRLRDMGGASDLIPELFETSYFKRISLVHQREQARTICRRTQIRYSVDTPSAHQIPPHPPWLILRTLVLVLETSLGVSTQGCSWAIAS
ncbi:unnamed protein product [Closterium sp. NIES-53]